MAFFSPAEILLLCCQDYHFKDKSLSLCLKRFDRAFLLPKIQPFIVDENLFMKSFMAKQEHAEHKWFLVDADGAVLGRMAAKIAPMLIGKTKPTYTPHVDAGDYVIVVNADKIKVTGKKAQAKVYDYYTLYPGGNKVVSFKEMMAKRPEKVVKLAVARMLPKNKIGRKMLTRLKVYRGPDHDHQAQKPQKIEII